MALSARIQNAVIAGLAALALGMSAFAVWSVGSGDRTPPCRGAPA